MTRKGILAVAIGVFLSALIAISASAYLTPSVAISGTTGTFTGNVSTAGVLIAGSAPTTITNATGTLKSSALDVPLIFTIGWDGYLGIITNAATKTMVAPCTGHFTSLSCVAILTGTCTTVPVVNVTDVTGSTTGTASTLTTTVGTPVTHAQTLVFTAGDVIGLAQTASPATCTTPMFACQGTATCP